MKSVDKNQYTILSRWVFDEKRGEFRRWNWRDSLKDKIRGLMWCCAITRRSCIADHSVLADLYRRARERR